jgi:hypothetical protein
MLQLNENYSNSNSVAVLGTASPSDMGQIFSYNGNSVRMRKMNGYILVCLTDFAKPFPDKNLSTIINSTSNPQLSSSASFLRLNILSSLN